MIYTLCPSTQTSVPVLFVNRPDRDIRVKCSGCGSSIICDRESCQNDILDLLKWFATEHQNTDPEKVKYEADEV